MVEFRVCPNCKRNNILTIIDNPDLWGHLDVIVIHDDKSACKVPEYMWNPNYKKRENNIKVEIKKASEVVQEVKKKRGRPKKDDKA